MPRAAIYLLFVLSGFVGLIYEGIWSRYLKLFLGHSSYGQVLTLVTFMGGIGLGSFLAAKFIGRIKNPFRVYAIIEFLAAGCGIAFHFGYEALTVWYFENAAMFNGVPWLGKGVQVGLCLLLTLPFATLLGMTYPILASGMIRICGDSGARSLPMLYFTNSLGAATGILVTSYYFLGQFGTIGTLMIAGLGNAIVGVGFYLISRSVKIPERNSAPAAEQATLDLGPELSAGEDRSTARLWLAVALGTGFASFIYEIGWIRLLSLIMGSSTHSFDVMISAFVFGLAFGGLAARKIIRKHADNIAPAMATVQILMGGFAMLSIILHKPFFDAIQASHGVLVKSEAAYPIYSIFKYFLALGLMFPASFCAGMTLPMITYYLVRRNGDERFTGSVYGWNTLGAIGGAAIAGLLLMPLLQLKWTIFAGAALDIALGVLLLVYATRGRSVTLVRGLAYAGVAAVCVAGAVTSFDASLLTRGSYRLATTGDDDGELLEVRHGRTATISVRAFGPLLSIATNGKPDGAIFRSAEAAKASPRKGDEGTVAQLALLPMLTRDEEPYDAAVIGMGTGMTLQYLLSDSLLKSADLIEIEPAMIELAEHFRPRNERCYTDPRVRFIIDDAKSYFYSTRQQYDVIISEPSNPWVSGISGLFTREFYTHTQRFLKPGGVLVQWVHGYEFQDDLMLSILTALDEFEHFEIYAIHGMQGDFAILASDSPIELTTLDKIGARSTFDEEFEATGFNLDLCGARQFIASSETLAPVLEGYRGMANSDYFPYLDHFSEVAFYTKRNVQMFDAFTRSFSRYEDLFSPAHSERRRSASLQPIPRRLVKDQGYQRLCRKIATAEAGDDWDGLEEQLVRTTFEEFDGGHWGELEAVRNFQKAVEEDRVAEAVALRFQLLDALAARDFKAVASLIDPVITTSEPARLQIPVWRRTLLVEAIRAGQAAPLRTLAAKAIEGNPSIAESERLLIDDLYSRAFGRDADAVEVASIPVEE